MLAYLGALTHPFLDLLTTYSVQLFSPFSSAWYHCATLLFIIDIWVWLLLAIAIGISKKREQKGARMAAHPAQIAAIAMLLAYIGVNLAISQRRDTRMSAAADPRAEAMFASPPPVMSWRRDLVWRDGARLLPCAASTRSARASASAPVAPSNMDDPLVREAIRRDPRLQQVPEMVGARRKPT